MSKLTDRLRDLALTSKHLCQSPECAEPQCVAEQAANELESQRARLADCELALRHWDNHRESEYWLRHADSGTERHE